MECDCLLRLVLKCSSVLERNHVPSASGCQIGTFHFEAPQKASRAHGAARITRDEEVVERLTVVRIRQIEVTCIRLECIQVLLDGTGESAVPQSLRCLKPAAIFLACVVESTSSAKYGCEP